MAFEGFSKESTEAGRKWFTFLLKRYPKLKVKDGVTNLSIARAKASDRDSVTRWYKKYQNVLDQLEITDPKYIWNIDEHGIRRHAKSEESNWFEGHKTVSETTSREAKADHDANLCKCSRLCIASPSDPQGQIP